MRQLALCIVFAVFGGALASIIQPPEVGAHDVDPYIFEDLINRTIESIRSSIPDTISIEDLNITIPDELTDILQGSFDVNDFELVGLNKFQISSLNLAILELKLNFTLVLPSLNINTNYVGDLLLAKLVPLYGNGKANFHIKGAEIQGSGSASLTNGISIKDLRIQLALEDTAFAIQGALDNEDFSVILSSLLNDVVTSFINDHQSFISNVLSPILEALINGILSGTEATTVAPTPVEP